MTQNELWHDTIYDALGAAVQAAGGVKQVAGRLWPALDITSAAARLWASMNPEHAQKLDLHELEMVDALAREAGDMSLPGYLARKWSFEARSLTPAEAKKQARKQRKLTLFAEIARLEREDE